MKNLIIIIKKQESDYYYNILKPII